MGKATRSTLAQLSSRAIPALSPRRRVGAKLPGSRYPDVAARRGRADAQVQPQLKLNRGDPIHYEFTPVSARAPPFARGIPKLSVRSAAPWPPTSKPPGIGVIWVIEDHRALRAI